MKLTARLHQSKLHNEKNTPQITQCPQKDLITSEFYRIFKFTRFPKFQIFLPQSSSRGLLLFAHAWSVYFHTAEPRGPFERLKVPQNHSEYYHPLPLNALNLATLNVMFICIYMHRIQRCSYTREEKHFFFFLILSNCVVNRRQSRLSPVSSF